MAGINPFAKRAAEINFKEITNLSGFERLEEDYVRTCEQIGKLWRRSPQNRRVREAADMIMAAKRRSK